MKEKPKLRIEILSISFSYLFRLIGTLIKNENQSPGELITGHRGILLIKIENAANPHTI